MNLSSLDRLKLVVLNGRKFWRTYCAGIPVKTPVDIAPTTKASLDRHMANCKAEQQKAEERCALMTAGREQRESKLAQSREALDSKEWAKEILGQFPEQPISGPPACDKTKAVAPLAKERAGAPRLSPAPAVKPVSTVASLDRYHAAIRGLDLHGVAVQGNEPLEVLEGKLAAAQAESRARQKSYDEAMKEHAAQLAANPAPKGFWTEATTGELIDAVFGDGCNRRVIGHPAGDSGDKPSTYTWHTPEQRARAQAKFAISNTGPRESARRFTAQKQFVASWGLTVPGLDLAGCDAELCEDAACNPQKQALAQQRVDAYCAVLKGDVSAQQANTDVSRKARALCAQASGAKRFTLGMSCLKVS